MFVNYCYLNFLLTETRTKLGEKISKFNVDEGSRAFRYHEYGYVFLVHDLVRRAFDLRAFRQKSLTPLGVIFLLEIQLSGELSLAFDYWMRTSIFSKANRCHWFSGSHTLFGSWRCISNPRLRSRSKSTLIRPSQTSGTSDQTVPDRSDLWSDEYALEDHCALEVRSKPPLIRRVPDRSDLWSDKFQTISRRVPDHCPD